MKALELAKMLLEQPNAIISVTTIVSDGTPAGLKDERRVPYVHYSTTRNCFDIQPTALPIHFKKRANTGLVS